MNGTVYLQDLKSNVYAIDFRSGELEWQKRYNADNVGPNGAGFDDGKLFVTNGMQTVVALDATSGKEIWSKRIVSVVTQGITQQLTAHDGILYVSTIPGSSASHFYEGGGMGIIHALDERTGNELWSFNTVKNGQLWGNPKVNSGGGAWYPPAVDTSNGTTYWGIGNPAPFPGTKAFPSGFQPSGPQPLHRLRARTGQLRGAAMVPAGQAPRPVRRRLPGLAHPHHGDDRWVVAGHRHRLRQARTCRCLRQADR